MKTLLACIVLVVWANMIFAQQIIKGIVTDKGDKALPNVTVGIKNTDTKTVSDEKGKYSITVPKGAKTLTFQLEKYQVKEVEITSDSINIKMSDEVDIFSLSLEELLKIEVTTAGKKAQKISEVPASSIVITREEIERYGYRDLQEILEGIAGFYFTSEYSSDGGSVNVRGFWSLNTTHVAILVNGVPQCFERLRNYSIETMGIPIESIERVELVRGPMSVIYGSGAFFGVINIVTHSSTTPTNLISVSGGSLNRQKAVVNCAGKEHDFEYSLNASYFKEDGENFAYNDLMKTPATYAGQTWGSKVLAIENKYFNFWASMKGFYTSFSYTDAVHGVITHRQPFYNSPFRTKDAVSLIKLGYRKTITDWFEFDINYMHSGREAIRDNTPGLPYSYYIEHSKSHDLELNLFFKVGEKLDITTGTIFYSNYLNNVIADITPVKTLTNSYSLLPYGDAMNNYAGFIDATYRPFSKLQITAGLRIEHQFGYNLTNRYLQELKDASGNSIAVEQNEKVPDGKVNYIPRLAAIYSISDNHILKLMYGKAINQPSIQLNWDIFNARQSYNLELDYLQPEEIQTLELNYNAVLSSKISTNISVFHNQLDNLIVRYLKANNTFYSLSSNSGKYVTNGIELAVNTRLLEKLNLDLALSYQDTKDKDNSSIEVGFSPQFLGYWKAAYTLPFFKNEKNLNQISIALSGNYVDKMLAYYDRKLDSNGNPVGRLGENIKAYHLLNANLRIENCLYKGIYIDVKSTNLLNTKYHYPTATFNAWTDKGMLGRGQYVMATLGYKF